MGTNPNLTPDPSDRQTPKLTRKQRELLDRLNRGFHCYYNTLGNVWVYQDSDFNSRFKYSSKMLATLQRAGFVERCNPPSRHYTHTWFAITPAGRVALLAADAGPTGFMRPCETCSGTGDIYHDGLFRHCVDCGGTGIYTEADAGPSAPGPKTEPSSDYQTWRDIDRELASKGLRRAMQYEAGWYVTLRSLEGGKIWATDEGMSDAPKTTGGES